MFDSIKNKFQFKFKDRIYAANILSAALEDFLRKEQEVKSNITVLGIPRGGVVIADIVATKLKASDFDIIIPRKLRIPYNEEAAFGAIMEDGTVYIEDRIVKDLDISQEYTEKEKNIQLEEIKRRSILYTEKKELSEQQQQEQQLAKEEGEEYKIKEEDNKITILVDDGAASGSTIIAAARSIRKKSKAKKLIIALPVAPKDTVELLRKEADHVEVVTTPSSAFFNSVGQYYQSFEPVNDEQVIEIARRRRKERSC